MDLVYLALSSYERWEPLFTIYLLALVCLFETESHYIHQPGLELTEILLPLLELQVCAPTPG